MKARHLAWAITAVTAGLAVATSAFALANDGARLPADEGDEVVSFAGELAYSFTFVAFAALGALLASRRPRSPIGWLLCLSPLSLGLSGLVTGWYVHAFYAAPGSTAPPEALLWLGGWIWVYGFVPLITALLLLFPDGRPPSRRWRPVAAMVGLVLATMTLGYAFEPGPMDDFPRVENPLGLGGMPGELANALVAIGHGLLLLATIASAAALVTRFRRSREVERRQLKWMAAAATVAILRYRLYDLGRIVNRTLVYGALTLTLAATYLGLVLEALAAELRDAVSSTVQPAHLSLWLRR